VIKTRPAANKGDTRRKQENLTKREPKDMAQKQRTYNINPKPRKIQAIRKNVTHPYMALILQMSPVPTEHFRVGPPDLFSV